MLRFRVLPDEEDFVCLATLPKSGTHYMRHFLVNYLRRVAGIEGDVLFGQFLRDQYPNRRYHYLNGKEPFRETGPLPRGVRDVVSQHAFNDLDGFPGWIIAQIRNPLDYIVSQFHYRHQSRLDASLHVSGIDAVARDYALQWARSYVAFRGLAARPDKRVLALHYEELVTSPLDVFERTVRFLGQPVDASLIARTAHDIRAENFNRVVIENTPNPAFSVPIARNGSIGQWRTEMTEADIDVVRAVVKGRRLDLDAIMAEWGLPLDAPA